MTIDSLYAYKEMAMTRFIPILTLAIFLSLGCSPLSLDELKQKAMQGDVEAQYTLGHFYNTGIGAPKDSLEAVKWFRIAAELNYAEAQFSLGFMYDLGEGVPQDNIQAYKWSSLAAPKLKFRDREAAVAVRDGVESKMTVEQVNEAKRLAGEWRPKTWEVIRQELQISPPE